VLKKPRNDFKKIIIFVNFKKIISRTNLFFLEKKSDFFEYFSIFLFNIFFNFIFNFMDQISIENHCLFYFELR
jgi:hypothetical protein